MGYNAPKQTVSQFQLKGRYARQYLSFAGKSSKDFLLYLSGPGVYDSPAADVESTSVPGRNGDIITENARTGRRRYQNVDIKYKACVIVRTGRSTALCASPYHDLPETRLTL